MDGIRYNDTIYNSYTSMVVAIKENGSVLPTEGIDTKIRELI